jgi:hypothetical protein
MTKIYTLVNVLGEWMVEIKPPTFTNDSLAGPLASFVLDPVDGNELSATAESLSAAMQAHQNQNPDSKGKERPPHCIWISASRKSIRAAVNFNGERVAKVELEQEEFSEAFYVTRHGECSETAKQARMEADDHLGQKIIVGITTTGTALVYSVPFLEPITRMDLFFGAQRQVDRHPSLLGIRPWQTLTSLAAKSARSPSTTAQAIS